MSFVSLAFLIFYAIVFILYYALPGMRTQNLLILVASYFFYGWWDWRFMPLLLGISLTNFITAIVIERAEGGRTKKIFFLTSLAVSLGALALFDFFSQSLAALARSMGFSADFPTLRLILPLGISFMTFQGLAYVIDVWRGKQAAETDLVRFLAFKAFFPQLIAGPIERANHLLTQFAHERSLDGDKVRQAIWLLVYGFTIKIVIADGLAPIVDSVFTADQPFGWSVVLGTMAFGLQIYTDFNGYSLIAKGLALLLGFDLIWNFRFPYWAVSPRDFWQRWHVSLSGWLRDYLYIPLGGNRYGRYKTIRNLYITMLLGGLWHGASWNFVGWGFLHGTALATSRLFDDAKPNRAQIVAGWASTMIVVFVGWFFFRATSYSVLHGMLAALNNMEWAPVHGAIVRALFAAALPLFAIEWVQQRTGDDFVLMSARPWATAPILACFCVSCLIMLRQYRATFIYFQF
jgi:D-alanyl-lipoteichoic acid acyltransferase DltB (MBOAT superfamily)